MDSFPASIKPHYITTETSVFNTKIVQFENGSEQTFSNYRAGRELYEFKWSILNETEKDILKTFFQDQRGKGKKWLITDDRIGASVVVRFDEDELKIERINTKFFSAAVKVVTC